MLSCLLLGRHHLLLLHLGLGLSLCHGYLLLVLRGGHLLLLLLHRHGVGLLLLLRLVRVHDGLLSDHWYHRLLVHDLGAVGIRILGLHHVHVLLPLRVHLLLREHMLLLVVRIDLLNEGYWLVCHRVLHLSGPGLLTVLRHGGTSGHIPHLFFHFLEAFELVLVVTAGILDSLHLRSQEAEFALLGRERVLRVVVIVEELHTVGVFDLVFGPTVLIIFATFAARD